MVQEDQLQEALGQKDALGGVVEQRVPEAASHQPSPPPACASPRAGVSPRFHFREEEGGVIPRFALGAGSGVVRWDLGWAGTAETGFA